MKLCRDCPKPVPGPRRVLCDTCRDASLKESHRLQMRRWRAAHPTTPWEAGGERRCRDCPNVFQITDVRRLLCDACRKSKRRKIVARANKKWWAAVPAFRRHVVHKRQYQGRLQALNRLTPELRETVVMLNNLKKRIYEEQNRRSAKSSL